MFGVSPAFVFSLYGTGFTVPDFCDALPRIKQLGFEAFQPEIYVANAISEWLREAGRLQRTAADLNLVPTQFVAHFMLEWFASPERLGPDQGLDDLKRVIEVAQAFPACRVITVPAGQFQVEWASPAARSEAGWREMQQRLIEKIRRYLEVVSCAGLKLAFEIMPFSVIGGIRRFLDLCEQVGSPDLGLNFDTGHAWACRELVPLLPFELRGRIFGTHLGDNRSTEKGDRAWIRSSSAPSSRPSSARRRIAFTSTTRTRRWPSAWNWSRRWPAWAASRSSFRTR